MKRDMDLVRSILAKVEEEGKVRGWIRDLSIPNHSAEEVSYHIQLLAEAGLLEALTRKTLGNLQALPMRLTWAGHEFLDAARNDTVWNKAKELVKDKGGAVPFEVLKGLLIKVASSVFGLG
ncbi:MAG: DUF2513 domain-containing protein [Gemmataceae bacterium]|nr:DUF2513 domain-containing protein [Gemmataceae bacterium]